MKINLDRQARFRLWAVVMALAILTAFVAPSDAFEMKSNVLLGFLWVSWCLTCWSIYFKNEFLSTFWTASAIAALCTAFLLGYMYPAIVVMAWGLWYFIAKARITRSLLLLVFAFSMAHAQDAKVEDNTAELLKELEKIDQELEADNGEASPAEEPVAEASEKDKNDEPINDGKKSEKIEGQEAPVEEAEAPSDEEIESALGLDEAEEEEKPAEKAKKKKARKAPQPVMVKVDKKALPKFINGYRLRDFNSCRTVSKIPWKFKTKQRNSRLLLRDTLRLNTETGFSVWSLYQVMDKNTTVTYVFRRVLTDGSYESILLKDNFYNRIIESGNQKKVVNVRDLSSLIDVPAVEFYAEDGSRISYLPGLAGDSSLHITHAPEKRSRILPPIFLNGRYCDRPEDSFDQNPRKASEEKDEAKTQTGGKK